jgi:glycosyltransferase involved in cell wall biosynthesis
MKIVVSVHGRFHAFELATELFRHNCLAQLVTTYPSFVARRFLPPDLPLRTIPWLEVLRRLHDRFHGPSPDHFIARRFAAFSSARLPPDADLLVGWSAASLEVAREAKRLGMAVVIERGSTHIAHQNAVLAESHARWGLPYSGIDRRVIAREIEEYALADLIVTGSSVAAASFASQGTDSAKVAINAYGVNLKGFAYLPRRREQRPLRILFVGQVGLRKGVPWLLEAFARLTSPAELHLVGPIDPAFRPLLPKLPLNRVRLCGPLGATALAEAFTHADLFCLPSIEEGFGMVLLQAMAAGLPVVATTATGAIDVPAARPLVIPPADSMALAEALAAMAGDPDRRQAMGEAGRRAVVSGFTWADHRERAMALYRKLRPQ